MFLPPQIPYIVDWGGTQAPVAHYMSLPTETVFNAECNSFFSSAYFAHPSVTLIPSIASQYFSYSAVSTTYFDLPDLRQVFIYEILSGKWRAGSRSTAEMRSNFLQ